MPHEGKRKELDDVRKIVRIFFQTTMEKYANKEKYNKTFNFSGHFSRPLLSYAHPLSSIQRGGMAKQLVPSVTEASLEVPSNNCQRYYGMECARRVGRCGPDVKHVGRSNETVGREEEQGNATQQSNSRNQIKCK